MNHKLKQVKIKLIFLRCRTRLLFKCNGGIDSGTLLYCIRKTMTDHNKFKPIYAITTQNKNDKACGYRPVSNRFC